MAAAPSISSSNQKRSYSPSIKSPPLILHNRSVSNSPSLLVNANKLLSDRPQLIDCPRCKVCLNINLFLIKHLQYPFFIIFKFYFKIKWIVVI